jgi:hypothetical protein
VGEARDVLTRSRLLPAYVEVLLAGQEVSAARLAAEELTSAVESFDTPYLRAVAAHAIGAVRLAEGDANAALTALRGAWGSWQELNGLYEAARVRVLIGLACRALGDTDTAAMEFDAAAWIFRQLGAAYDLARVEQLSGAAAGAPESPFRLGSLPDRVVTPLGWFIFSRVLTTRTPVGRKLRQTFRTSGTPLVRVRPKDLAAVGVERVPRTAEVRTGVPVLADGRMMEVSNVIWCTGFRPDFDWIDLPILDDAGHVVHQRGVVSSAPGLYVVGQFFLHSLTSSLVGGVGRDTAYIARHIGRSPAATSQRASRGDLPRQ